jgi:ribonuclease HI
VIAEVEDLDRTLARFPDLSKKELTSILRGERPQLELFEPLSIEKPSAEGKGARSRPLEPEREILYIWTDGASRGNPGPASIGVMIKNADKKTLAAKGQVIGRRTNNVAEWEAVRYALECAVHLRAKKVHLRADSQLVIRQLTGEYRVKNEDLRPIYEAVKTLEARIAKGVVYEHVPREENREADHLANVALDEAGDVD